MATIPSNVHPKRTDDLACEHPGVFIDRETVDTITH